MDDNIPETMRLLDTTSGRGSRFASLLGSELLARGLATSRLASGLLSAGHLFRGERL